MITCYELHITNFACLSYYIKPHLQNTKSLLYNDFNGRRKKTRPKT